MKILYAASEGVPFSKTGGLGDVAGALPQALKSLGADIEVVLPLYDATVRSFGEKLRFEFEFPVRLAWRNQHCKLYSSEYKGVKYLFIGNDYYFLRGAIYGEYDDGERFAFFSKAVAELARTTKPDIIHINDWQTGLVPLYTEGIKTVYTIHNMEYNGYFGKDTVGNVFGLEDKFPVLEFGDGVSLLKAGMMAADAITTVSRSYAREVERHPVMGATVQLVKHKLRGIVNGIDMEKYSPGDMDKAECKRKLQQRFGLPVREDVPVLGCVSRIVEHKGFDLLLGCMTELMERDVQLVILGQGEPRLEDGLRFAAQRYPDKVSVNIMYSEDISFEIYRGADMFLMPSRTEPCGLAQLAAMRYGTLPVVHATGGLKDTVEHGRTGFVFDDFSASGLLGAVDESIAAYRDKERRQVLMRAAMERDSSWEQSAKEYMEVYVDGADTKQAESAVRAE